MIFRVLSNTHCSVIKLYLCGDLAELGGTNQKSLRSGGGGMKELCNPGWLSKTKRAKCSAAVCSNIYEESCSKCLYSFNGTFVVSAVSPVSILLGTWCGPRWKVIPGGRASYTITPPKEQ